MGHRGAPRPSHDRTTPVALADDPGVRHRRLGLQRIRGTGRQLVTSRRHRSLTALRIAPRRLLPEHRIRGLVPALGRLRLRLVGRDGSVLVVRLSHGGRRRSVGSGLRARGTRTHLALPRVVGRGRFRCRHLPCVVADGRTVLADIDRSQPVVRRLLGDESRSRSVRVGRCHRVTAGRLDRRPHGDAVVPQPPRDGGGQRQHHGGGRGQPPLPRREPHHPLLGEVGVQVDLVRDLLGQPVTELRRGLSDRRAGEPTLQLALGRAGHDVTSSAASSSP